jgi:hypothetical protein
MSSSCRAVDLAALVFFFYTRHHPRGQSAWMGALLTTRRRALSTLTLGLKGFPPSKGHHLVLNAENAALQTANFGNFLNNGIRIMCVRAPSCRGRGRAFESRFPQQFQRRIRIRLNRTDLNQAKPHITKTRELGVDPVTAVQWKLARQRTRHNPLACEHR